MKREPAACVATAGLGSRPPGELRRGGARRTGTAARGVCPSAARTSQGQGPGVRGLQGPAERGASPRARTPSAGASVPVATGAAGGAAGAEPGVRPRAGGRGSSCRSSTRRRRPGEPEAASRSGTEGMRFAGANTGPHPQASAPAPSPRTQALWRCPQGPGRAGGGALSADVGGDGAGRRDCGAGAWAPRFHGGGRGQTRFAGEGAGEAGPPAPGHTCGPSGGRGAQPGSEPRPHSGPADAVRPGWARPSRQRARVRGEGGDPGTRPQPLTGTAGGRGLWDAASHAHSVRRAFHLAPATTRSTHHRTPEPPRGRRPAHTPAAPHSLAPPDYPPGDALTYLWPFDTSVWCLSQEQPFPTPNSKFLNPIIM